MHASSTAFPVRAVDIQYAFVGLNNADVAAQFYHTTQTKHWCLPDEPCEEWSGDAHVVTPFADIPHARSSATHGTTYHTPDTGPDRVSRARGTSTAPWPPLPLPWAHTALLRPGRSAGTGGWYNGKFARYGIGICREILADGRCTSGCNVFVQSV